MYEIIDELIEAIGKDAVLTNEEAKNRPASLWKDTGQLDCLALLLPSTTEEVSQIMRICTRYQQPIVPRGGLTGVTEGHKTTKNEIAISLERLNQIEEINTTDKTATVGAGVILQDLQKRVDQENLLFALNLGAKGSCMIGGNIATNAGGLEALRYGLMRNLVLGLEVVLADGTIVSSMNKMLKNNAGYDLKQLFIGTEGTLGIVTRAIVKLEEKPTSCITAYVAFNSFEMANTLLQLAKKELHHQLNSYEIMWNGYYTMMTTAPSPFAAPLPQTYAYYVLLEVKGQNQEQDQLQLENFLAENIENEIIADATLAQTSSDHDWFWNIRENIEWVFNVYQPVFSFDISLPISEMENYATQIQHDIKQVWPSALFFLFGHMADGNLHLHLHCGEKFDIPTRDKVYDIIFAPLKNLQGSVTAEHGIGLEKKKWLSWCRKTEEIALMKTIKIALDPLNLLNPGKIFDIK